MFRSIPKCVIVILALYILLLISSVIAPGFMMEIFQYFFVNIVVLFLFPISVGWISCLGRILTGDFILLLPVVVCFISSYFLRRHLPEESRALSYCWPLICFMVGIVYHKPFQGDELDDFFIYIPFYLCLVPAWIGLYFGRLKKHKIMDRTIIS